MWLLDPAPPAGVGRLMFPPPGVLSTGAGEGTECEMRSNLSRISSFMASSRVNVGPLGVCTRRGVRVCEKKHWAGYLLRLMPTPRT